MKRWRGLVWLLLWGVVGCQSAEMPLEPTVVVPQRSTLSVGVTSSSAELPTLAPFDPPDATLQFVVNNTSALFDDLDSGTVDAILVNHFPLAYEAPGRVWFTPVALDGLVVIVHPENPVVDLTIGQVQAIFSGRFTRWAQVGGADVPIDPVVRERGAGVRALFEQRVMAEQRVSINAVVQSTPLATIAYVADHPNAIGIAMLGSMPRATADLTRFVRMVALDGVAPGPLTVADQSYPLSVPLYFVDSAEPTGPMRAYVAWLQSDEGQNALGVRYGRVR